MNKYTCPKIFVVDDDSSVRTAICRLLKSFDMNAEAYASAEDFLAAFDEQSPGCLVLDVAMPGLGGLALQDALTDKAEAPPIIFLTGHATIPDSVRALKHGAVEFLTKPVDEQELLDAIRCALEKDCADRQRHAEQACIAKRLESLTPRESEVMRHVVTGKLNKQIAWHLGTVEKTIKVHRARVMEKMHAQSLAELVIIAANAGMISPSSPVLMTKSMSVSP